jgi:hypothetical protein
MRAFIYALNDPETGKCRYVGKAANPKKRFRAHINRAKASANHKDCWILGLRQRGLTPVLEVLDEVPAQKWEFWEREYIRVFRAIGFDLTNLSDGGGCGMEGKAQPESQRRGVSRALKGRPKSPEHCLAVSRALTGKKGRPHTPEWKAAQSLRMRGERHPLFGKKLPAHTAEWKANMSARMSGVQHPMFGKKMSLQHRENISKSKRGEKHPCFGKRLSEETRRRISETKKSQAAARKTACV